MLSGRGDEIVDRLGGIVEDMSERVIAEKLAVDHFVHVGRHQLEDKLGNDQNKDDLDELSHQEDDLEENWQVVRLAPLEDEGDEEDEDHRDNYADACQINQYCRHTQVSVVGLPVGAVHLEASQLREATDNGGH